MGTSREGNKSGQIIKIEEEKLHRHLDKIVRGTVEETLNELHEAEADRLCQARRYERTESRKDTRAGHYPLKLKDVGCLQQTMDLVETAIDLAPCCLGGC